MWLDLELIGWQKWACHTCMFVCIERTIVEKFKTKTWKSCNAKKLLCTQIVMQNVKSSKQSFFLCTFNLPVYPLRTALPYKPNNSPLSHSLRWAESFPASMKAYIHFKKKKAIGYIRERRNIMRVGLCEARSPPSKAFLYGITHSNTHTPSGKRILWRKLH